MKRADDAFMEPSQGATVQVTTTRSGLRQAGLLVPSSPPGSSATSRGW